MITRQKRDADMDRLLRAVLRPAPQGSAGECPEPSALAAFVEGGLTATEQSALDAHIVNCRRCQESLAVMSHELPREEEELVAAPQSGWFTWVTRPRLRWLVPISAAATVAVVVFATRPLIAPEGEESSAQVAQMAQTPPEPERVPAAERLMDRDKAAPVAPAKPEAESAGRLETGRRQANQLAEAMQVADEPPPLAGQAAPERKAPAEAVAAEPGGLAAPAKSIAAAKVPAADTMRAMPAPPSIREELRRIDPIALVTAAPDGTVRWRFGPGGRVWRSTDAGSTWHEQRSGVSASLVAGSAPSATTCWAVGTAGVVLLTEDGQRWTLLPFPLSVDLVSVQAADSRIATVTTRDGRRFETLDAGLTWSQKQ